MSFNSSAITQVFPPQVNGASAVLSWESSAPPGTPYQVYVGGVLQYHGFATRCHIPWPTGNVWIDVGTVAPEDILKSFAGSLPSKPTQRATLAWQGGRHQNGGDVKGFRVYGSGVAGGEIDYTVVLADIPVFVGRRITDGFGNGRFGSGGFGFVAGTYSWTSGPLDTGVWLFGIKTYGQTGDEGDPMVTTFTSIGPPYPPAPFPGSMSRLTYGIDSFGQTQFGQGGFGMPGINLFWNPSPA